MKPDHEQPNQYNDRRSTRMAVESTATMRSHSWYSVEVKVRDVSQCGFRAECNEPVQIGSYVTLDVPGIGSVQAQVRWQLAGRMGGMFLDPIRLSRCEWIATPAESAAA